MKEFIVKFLTVLGIAQVGSPIQDGQPAYLFSLQNHEGRVVNLYDYKGRWVVIYFYPKADTPGCTIQAKLDKFGLRVIKVQPYKTCTLLLIGTSPTPTFIKVTYRKPVVLISHTTYRCYDFI